MTLLIVCGLPLFNCAFLTGHYSVFLVLLDGRFGRNYSKLGNGVGDVPRETQNLYPRGSLNVQLCDCDWHSLSLKQTVKPSWNNFLQFLASICSAIVCRCPVSNIALTTNCVFLSASVFNRALACTTGVIGALIRILTQRARHSLLSCLARCVKNSNERVNDARTAVGLDLLTQETDFLR